MKEMKSEEIKGRAKIVAAVSDVIKQRLCLMAIDYKLAPGEMLIVLSAVSSELCRHISKHFGTDLSDTVDTFNSAMLKYLDIED